VLRAPAGTSNVYAMSGRSYNVGADGLVGDGRRREAADPVGKICAHRGVELGMREHQMKFDD
jgi:hypothetical protein